MDREFQPLGVWHIDWARLLSYIKSWEKAKHNPLDHWGGNFTSANEKVVFANIYPVFGRAKSTPGSTLTITLSYHYEKQKQNSPLTWSLYRHTVVSRMSSGKPGAGFPHLVVTVWVRPVWAALPLGQEMRTTKDLRNKKHDTQWLCISNPKQSVSRLRSMRENVTGHFEKRRDHNHWSTILCMNFWK